MGNDETFDCRWCDASWPTYLMLLSHAVNEHPDEYRQAVTRPPPRESEPLRLRRHWQNRVDVRGVCEAMTDPQAWAVGDFGPCRKLETWQEAVTPTAVLALLDEIDALRTERDDAIIDVENGKRRLRDLDRLARRVEVGAQVAAALRGMHDRFEFFAKAGAFHVDQAGDVAAVAAAANALAAWDQASREEAE